MPDPRVRSAVVVSAAFVLALAAGCAPVPPRAPAAAPAAADPPGWGVIVAERPVKAEGSGAADMRGAIMATLGDAPIVDAADAAGAVEFIVRRDDGQTISVVQGNAQHLRPGERVAIRTGARTLLVRAAAGPGG